MPSCFCSGIAEILSSIGPTPAHKSKWQDNPDPSQPMTAVISDCYSIASLISSHCYILSSVQLERLSNLALHASISLPMSRISQFICGIEESKLTSLVESIAPQCPNCRSPKTRLCIEVCCSDTPLHCGEC